MGCSQFQIANAITGVVNQRLIRRNCSKCQKPYEVPQGLIKELKRQGLLGKEDSSSLKQSMGCDSCNHTGFSGRVGVYEILWMTPILRELINQEAGPEELKKAAKASKSIVTMKSFSRNLLKAGLASPSEVLRILHTEGVEIM